MTTTELGEGKAAPAVLAALREIDPNADLIHLGGTRWWLGTRGPNPAAREKLASVQRSKVGMAVFTDPAEQAMVADRLGKELEMLRIMAEGFRPIMLYEIQGEPGMGIVEDFRIRDWNWRNKSQAEIQKELREATSIEEGNKPRVRAWAERAKDAASEAWRFCFKRARSVTVDAQLE